VLLASAWTVTLLIRYLWQRLTCILCQVCIQ
jgi:hypothetical protein